MIIMFSNFTAIVVLIIICVNAIMNSTLADAPYKEQDLISPLSHIDCFFLQMLQRIGKRRESLSSTLLSWRSNLLLIITILIIITLITIVAMKNMIMLEFSTLLLFWRPGHHHCDKEYEDDNNCRGQYSLCGGINDMYCSVFE